MSIVVAADNMLGLNTDMEMHLNSYEFKIGFMRKMAQGMITGHVNAFLVSGTPGVGKSYNLEELLNMYNEEGTINYTRISGKIAPMSFFEALRTHSSKKDVLFFDDCDSILHNEDSMNVLKAAAELKRSRVISWVSRANTEDNSFIYEGKVIIATNIRMRDNAHFDAVMDRFHVYELDVTLEEKLAKIQNIALNSPDIAEYCPPETVHELIAFIMERREMINPDKLTIRTFMKLAELSNMLSDDWRSYAIIGKYVPVIEGK